MEVGRPTKYNEDIIQKTKVYLETYEELGDVIPSIAGLAYYLEIERKTIYNWMNEHQEFLHIAERLLSNQEKTLISSGLKGDFNSSITKLILSKHGYSDKIETDITSKGEKIFNTKELSDEELAHIATTSTSGTSTEGTSEETP